MKFWDKFENVLLKFRSLFFKGFLTLLPITVTVLIFDIIYELISKWLAPLKRVEPFFLQRIPGIEFILVVTFILIIGTLARLLIIAPILHYFEKVIHRIPLIRSVYSSAKTLVDFFNIPNPAAVYNKVILIDYPQKGCYHLAFLLDETTNYYQKIIPENQYSNGKKYYKVFMPNSPNPTSGYFFILPEDMIYHTDITFEEAIKALVSCGLINPESLKQLPAKKIN